MPKEPTARKHDILICFFSQILIWMAAENLLLFQDYHGIILSAREGPTALHDGSPEFRAPRNPAKIINDWLDLREGEKDVLTNPPARAMLPNK
jgi:hypothetical protein